ncbi:MAG: class I adenylate cyclase [Candidatus Adiutrix sp.]|jgi:adenylate cyclase class 1|nr:class I adenylate cyclase [Candidatus Adiutrix sp.]
MDQFTSEALNVNRAAQRANNHSRIRELHSNATPGFARVFDLVPLLLNQNDPSRPGYVSDPATPFGIKFIEEQPWLPDRDPAVWPEVRPPARPVVESLFLIGSSGSVGHNSASDLDYWVCYRAEALAGARLELFQRKLAAITDWARTEHQTEAHFYLVNLADLAQGRLTRLDTAESEGEVAPLLLLEEFYRTLLFVAGRPPLWSVLPLAVKPDSYLDISRTIAADPETHYVDMGFPALPCPQEILAAALWLARKSEADPFKGILKIVALLDYVESDFNRELLCYQVKEAVLNSPADSLPVDPYIMTIERVAKFGEIRLTPEQLDLLRTASALKLMGDSGPAFFTHPANEAKLKALTGWGQTWGWSRDRLVHLSNHRLWPERQWLNLGGELLNMLTSVYIRIAQHLLQRYPGQLNPQDEELAPLAARLLSRMGGLDCTVSTLPSQMHHSSLSSHLVLQRVREANRWDLHTVKRPGEAATADNLIGGHPRAVRMAAWLVHNHLYAPGMTLDIRQDPADSAHLDQAAMLALLGRLDEAFPPFHLGHEQLPSLWSLGGQGRILVALNFELPPDQAGLVTADFILRTGWGEMRHFFLEVSPSESSATQYLMIIQGILKECGTCPRPESLVFQAPDTPAMHRATMNIKGGMAAAARRGRNHDGRKNRIDI